MGIRGTSSFIIRATLLDHAPLALSTQLVLMVPWSVSTPVTRLAPKVFSLVWIRVTPHSSNTFGKTSIFIKKRDLEKKTCYFCFCWRFRVNYLQIIYRSASLISSVIKGSQRVKAFPPVIKILVLVKCDFDFEIIWDLEVLFRCGFVFTSDITRVFDGNRYFFASSIKSSVEIHEFKITKIIFSSVFWITLDG